MNVHNYSVIKSAKWGNILQNKKCRRDLTFLAFPTICTRWVKDPILWAKLLRCCWINASVSQLRAVISLCMFYASPKLCTITFTHSHRALRYKIFGTWNINYGSTRWVNVKHLWIFKLENTPSYSRPDYTPFYFIYFANFDDLAFRVKTIKVYRMGG